LSCDQSTIHPTTAVRGEGDARPALGAFPEGRPAGDALELTHASLRKMGAGAAYEGSSNRRRGLGPSPVAAQFARTGGDQHAVPSSRGSVGAHSMAGCVAAVTGPVVGGTSEATTPWEEREEKNGWLARRGAYDRAQGSSWGPKDMAAGESRYFVGLDATTAGIYLYSLEGRATYGVDCWPQNDTLVARTSWTEGRISSCARPNREGRRWLVPTLSRGWARWRRPGRPRSDPVRWQN